MASEALALKCRKWMLVAGVSWALFACFHGLAIDNPMVQQKKMAKGAYHLLRHFSELLIGMAFMFPLVSLNDLQMKIAFYSLMLAPATNFISYMIVAITDCPNELFKNSPEMVSSGEENIYSVLSTMGLVVVTSPLVFAGLGLMIYGLVKMEVPSAGGKSRSSSGSPMKKKK